MITSYTSQHAWFQYCMYTHFKIYTRTCQITHKMILSFINNVLKHYQVLNKILIMLLLLLFFFFRHFISFHISCSLLRYSVTNVRDYFLISLLIQGQAALMPVCVPTTVQLLMINITF